MGQTAGFAVGQSLSDSLLDIALSLGLIALSAIVRNDNITIQVFTLWPVWCAAHS
jgi:hypothetical protein